MKNNTTIQAFTLDLWGTLILTNPEFKQKKITLLQQMTSKTPLEINSCFNLLKAKYDNTAVKSEFMFEQLKQTLEIPLSIEEIMDSYYTLFKQNPPLLCEPELGTFLNKIAKKHSIYLISNTLFVKGAILKDTLNTAYNGFLDSFSDLIFSDEVGYAKPDEAIFDLAYAQMTNICKDEVLHIGDNIFTDKEGAQSFGFNAALVDIKSKIGVTYYLKNCC